MSSKEIIKKLDEMITTKVNVLNYTLDTKETFEGQDKGWKRRYYELRGIITFAQNIDKHWNIEFEFNDTHSYTMKKIKITS